MATGPGGLYAPNGPGLTPSAFLRLPPDAVRPAGWLSTQLQNQLHGLNGQMTYVSHFLQPSTCGWITPSQYGWEEAPYWLRGYANLGYVTGDQATISAAAQWVTGTIATQVPAGFFGPDNVLTSLNGGLDPWPYMPMLRAVTSYAEFSGDTTVIPFLTRFFGYLAGQPASQISNGWGYTRWAEMMDSIIWLYNRTGDAWLLSLMTTIHQNSADWMTSSLPTLHNVNLAEGFREPAVYSQLGGPSYVQGTYDSYAQFMGTWGQVAGGGFGGDENCRAGCTDPRQGLETCGIVELMQSCEILVQVLGDPAWADRCEQLAFNMLPAALDPDQHGTHYITSPNCVQLDNVPKTMGQFDDNFALQAYMPGVDQYRCCPHNYGMGWPMFTQSLWLATGDNGLVASMYAPCTVTARVATGVTVTFTESTDYPFRGTVTLSLSAPGPLTFPLYLRVPGWCPDPAIAVNGQPVSAFAGPAYVKIARTWASGDTVTLDFAPQPSVTTVTAQRGAVTVAYGALQFSTQITEEWNQFGTTATLNNGPMSWPEYEVAPGSPWNYALVLGDSDPARALTVSPASGTLPSNPFTQPAPVSMTAPAVPLANWHADCMNVVTPLQASPAASALPEQAVTLIPMGAARLRISVIPVASSGGGTWLSTGGAGFLIENQNSGKVLGVSAMSTADSADVVQFDDNGTPDHLWQLIDNGDGYLRIQNVNSGKVLGVSAMSTADSADVVQFDDNGTPDHLWRLIDNGDGWFRIMNANSGKVLGVSAMSTADSAQVVQFDDNGTPDHLWRLLPGGQVKIQNHNSGLLCGVDQMSTADGADVVQFHDNGTPDHLWELVPGTGAWFRIQNVNSGKVLGVSAMSTADSAQVVQFDDNGTADHLWRLRYGGNTLFRLQNSNSGLVLAVSGMSLADSAPVVQFDDNGTADHLWQFLAAGAFDS
jgi:Beta-L-arabinofuranosidase, GH127 catalytic domain/Ricin-type beta-trefoil lectin domain-like/Beta-L-arabinofuranosidase, GH127 middle domain